MYAQTHEHTFMHELARTCTYKKAHMHTQTERQTIDRGRD